MGRAEPGGLGCCTWVFAGHLGMEWRGELLSPGSHLPCFDGRSNMRQDESNLLSILPTLQISH